MKQRGFTLIELLVVIAIIGILSSVVLASLNSARQKGRDAKRVSDISQLKLALELYFDSNRQYPTATTSLVPNYIPVWPVSPIAGDDGYGYTASGTTGYVLSAELEDTGHVVLTGDRDGTLAADSNVDCADPIYCVTP